MQRTFIKTTSLSVNAYLSNRTNRHRTIENEKKREKFLLPTEKHQGWRIRFYSINHIFYEIENFIRDKALSFEYFCLLSLSFRLIVLLEKRFDVSFIEFRDR